jgi:hypothetical protein
MAKTKDRDVLGWYFSVTSFYIKEKTNSAEITKEPISIRIGPPDCKSNITLLWIL